MDTSYMCKLSYSTMLYVTKIGIRKDLWMCFTFLLVSPVLQASDYTVWTSHFYLPSPTHPSIPIPLSLQEKRMRTLVHKPLCALRELLAGPRNLISKRLDKLLDYELIEEKPSLSYDEQAVANTYKTINTLLLNELPQFNGLALTLLWGMLGAFSCLHKDLAADMEQLFQGFTQQVHNNTVLE